MVGNFRSPDSTHRHLHFRKLQHGLLGLLLQLDGLSQRDTRQLHNLWRQGSFLKKRNELPPNEGDKAEATQHDHRRPSQDETSVPECPLQHRYIALFHPDSQTGFPWMIAPEKQRR